MAIQMRRGPYSSFNAANMVPGEFAFITSGDPNTDTGKAIYACFDTGTAVRFGTYAEVIAYILEQGYATGDVIAGYASTAQTAAQTATNAADSISSSAAQIAQNTSDIADIQPVITGALGTEIEENGDLNSLTTVGRYYSPNSTRTATLTNKPVGLPSAAFLLEVDTAGAWYRQTISSGHNTYPVKYVRNFAGTTFSPWERIAGPNVSNTGVIDLSGFICAGYLTGSQKSVYFCIPLPGIKGGVSSATLSGSYVIRNAEGGYIGVTGGQTLQSLGTVTVNVNANNIQVFLALKTASTFSNNTPVSVTCNSGTALTLS